MEPTTAERATFVDIRSLFEWAVVTHDGGFRASLLEALGDPVVLRDLGGTAETEFKAVVVGLMVTASATAPAVAGPATMATPPQWARAKLERLGRGWSAAALA